MTITYLKPYEDFVRVKKGTSWIVDSSKFRDVGLKD